MAPLHPPRHARLRRLGILVVLVAVGLSLGAVKRPGTYAAFSDFDVVHSSVGAAAWESPVVLPYRCTKHGISPVHYFLITDAGSFYSNGSSALVPLGPGKPGSSTTGAFHGTPDSDLIVNQGGKRTLHGWAGNDCIIAGTGGDILQAGAGTDVLIGGKKQNKGEHNYPAGP